MVIHGFYGYCVLQVVAHEISHSWTGNLVTNKTWEHFWLVLYCIFYLVLQHVALVKGFTVFLERKIVARMFGEKQRQFEATYW